jgi:hypothetical protein
MAGLLDEPHLLLRYEDRFFDDPGSVGRIADWLGLRPAPDVTQAIFARYATEAVRAFAARVPQLPPDRVERIPASIYDRVTHIHQAHIGDTRSGKWRDLPQNLQARLTATFRPFLTQFGYEA